MQYTVYVLIALILVSGQAVFGMHGMKVVAGGDILCGQSDRPTLCLGSDDESESLDEPMSACLCKSDWYWFHQSNKNLYRASSELMAKLDRSLMNSYCLKDLLKHPEVIAMMSEEAQNALKPWIQQPNNEKQKGKNEKTQNEVDNNIPPKSFKHKKQHEQLKVLD